MSKATTQPTALEIWLHDTLAGSLLRLPAERFLFTLDEAYANNPARPTLSLSLKTQAGKLRRDLPITTSKLPPLFSNLLPEGHLRQYLANKAGIHPDREFFLLHHLGQDLPGALRVKAKEEEAGAVSDMHPGAMASDIEGDALRFSLAGVQMKLSALLESRGGLTIPVHGLGGDWIVKLPSTQFQGVPENEHAMMQLAGTLGIEVPETRLIALDNIQGLPTNIQTAGLDQNALAVRRFDRGSAGERIHIEDMAQIFERRPEEKYEGVSYGNIARLLWLEAGEKSLAEFIRRLIFSALIGNADMHLKNWSVIYPDRIQPVLSPAYDLVCTIAYIQDDKHALSLAGSKRFADLDKARLERLIRKADLPAMPVLHAAQEIVERFHDLWPRHKNTVPDYLVRIIEAQAANIPLFQLK